jgi:lysophospholipase L1-like esterase
MGERVRKMLASALSLALIAGSIAVPIGASAAEYVPLVEGDTVLNEWKFDFGSADNVMDGYIAVTPDKNVITSKGTDEPYGFIGNDGNGSKVTPKYDSFEYKEGQTMKLVTGGDGENDGIGIEKNEEETYPQYTTGEYFPVSFGLYVDNGSYYRVRATITTLDPTKDAEASLYYERRHPTVHKQKINAGETLTVDFSADVEKVNFKNDGGNFNDDMLNISLLGENSALSSLIIQQIDETQENKPTTLWVLGDSTVTDGNAQVPYFDLQNYTGVGAYLSKYVPSTVAVSNQGEGGLNATDNNHFAIARDNIKAGDFMYVEYGHNHKNSSGQSFTSEYWLNNYLGSLPKYYNACKDAGATLIIVGPIDRHNTTQFDSATNTWSTTLAHFSTIGKKYIDALMYGGETAAASFVAKWKEISDYAEAHKTGSSVTEGTAAAELAAMKAEADKIVTDAVEGNIVQIDSVAFVDLNKPTLDWLTTVTAVEGSEGGNHALSNYYFTTARGGSTDGTHPNDAGADALAHKFFSTADAAAYPALAPLLTAYDSKEPVPVSSDIIAAGKAGAAENPYWPMYLSKVSYDYAAVIKKVTFNENNSPASVEIKVQDKSMMSTYSNAYFAVYNKETGVLEDLAVSTEHLDNTVSGTTTLPFETDLIYNSETQTYKVFLWAYKDDPEHGNPTTMQPYASVYVPTDVEEYLIKGDDGGDVETFEYYGTTNLNGAGAWKFGGNNNAEGNLTLGKDGDVTYATLAAGGNNSYHLMRPFDNGFSTGSTGKIMIDVDINYASGQGLNFGFAKATTPDKAPFITDGGFTAFAVGKDGAVTAGGKDVGSLIIGQWTNVKYILDMDLGTATVSVNGQPAVTADLSNYQNFEAASPDTFKHFAISGDSRTTFNAKISNMTVAKLAPSKLGQQTISVAVDGTCSDMGTVYIDNAGTTEKTVGHNEIVTIKAEANEGYEFVSWNDGEDTVSFLPEFNARAYKTATLTAKFAEMIVDPITYLYNEDFTKLTTATLDWTQNGKNTIENDSADGIGQYFYSISNSGSGNRSAYKAFPAEAQVNSDLILEFNMKMTRSGDRPNQFAIVGKGNGESKNNFFKDNIILSFTQVGSEEIYLNATDFGDKEMITAQGSTTGYKNNTWVKVTAQINFTDKKVAVKIMSLDGNTTYADNTVDMSGSITGLGAMQATTGRGSGAIGLDNIKVYTADQVAK